MDSYWKDTEKEVANLLIELCMDETSYEALKSCKTKEEYIKTINNLENKNIQMRLNNLHKLPPKIIEAVLCQLRCDLTNL